MSYARVATTLLILAMLTGCLPEPREESHGGSAVGGWQLFGSPLCTQHLSLDAAGRFSLASWIELGALDKVEQIEGTIAGAGGLAGGQFEAQFAPDAALPRNAGVYCHQWDQSPPTPVPFSAAEAALGVDPRSLTYTADLSSKSGLTLTGSDTNRRDRLILYVSEDRQLKALQANDPRDFPNGIYRALPSDPDQLSVYLSGTQLVHIPDRTWSAKYTGTAQGEVLEKLVLHVQAGADVTFSNFPKSSIAACTFVLYQDTTFSAPIVAGQLDPSAAVQTHTVNPADTAWPFASVDVSGVTAYLVPVAIRSPADGDCEAVIRTQTISARVASQHAATEGAPTIFSIPVPAAGGFLIAHPLDVAGHMVRIPLGPADLPLGLLQLTDSIVSIAELSGPGEATAQEDPLRLTGPGTAMAFVSVTSGAGTPTLGVFPAPDARTGFGPFFPATPASVVKLNVPDLRNVTAPYNGYPLDFRLRATATQPVAVWTTGGIATTGRLMDASGRKLMESAGGSDDGAGFRMEAVLTSGDYWLRVTAAAGSFTVFVDDLPRQQTFADAGLRACLVEAGWTRYPQVPLRSAWCGGRNIRDLDGLDLVTTLRALDLTDNALRRIDALQNLPSLETLRLGGNPLEDLSPLAGMPELRRLSLAGIALVENELSLLKGLSGHLLALDLTGVATLSDDQLSGLQTALPFTAIIGPEGILLP